MQGEKNRAGKNDGKKREGERDKNVTYRVKFYYIMIHGDKN